MGWTPAMNSKGFLETSEYCVDKSLRVFLRGGDGGPGCVVEGERRLDIL